MSGTDLACRATSLRACYAISGTDLACSAVGVPACYATSGTDKAYCATRVLRQERYSHSVWCQGWPRGEQSRR
eukprot:3630653-Rhodomonas_salina.2